MLRALTPHILTVGHDDRRYREAGVSVVVDRIAGAGALGGLYTAHMAAPTEQTVVIACDMPFLTAPFLAHLAACGADADGRLLINIDTPDDYVRALEAVEPPPRIA